MQDIKFKLKACRVNANLTVEQVCKELGICVKTLNSYENGRVAPSMDRAQRMSELYELPLSIMDFSRSGNSVFQSKRYKKMAQQVDAEPNNKGKKLETITI